MDRIKTDFMCPQERSCILESSSKSRMTNGLLTYHPTGYGAAQVGKNRRLNPEKNKYYPEGVEEPHLSPIPGCLTDCDSGVQRASSR